MASFTHYTPMLAFEKDGKRQAVCDTMVDPSAHSSEPTCPACVEYLRRLELPPTCVLVRPRIGEDIFSRATCEVLTDGTLRVSWLYTGKVAREYEPDRWSEAVIYDEAERVKDILFTNDRKFRADHERTALIA